MARRFSTRNVGFADTFADFLAEPRSTSHDISEVVRDILNDVRMRGGEAVREYTQKVASAHWALPHPNVSSTHPVATRARCHIRSRLHSGSKRPGRWRTSGTHR